MTNTERRNWVVSRHPVSAQGVVMTSRRRLWHTWDAQLRALLPQLRVTRVRVLALFVLGTLGSGQLALLRIAATLPLTARDVSIERRFQRFLANDAIRVPVWWRALLPALLAGKAGQDLTLVFDPTPQNGTASILCLSLVDHKRALPVAWRVVPQQTTWAERQITYLAAMVDEVRAALPADCVVTLLTDQGITGPAVIDLCAAVGWHFVLRVNVGPRQTNLVQIGDAAPHRLWALVTGPGQRWAGGVALFQDAGWRTVELTLRWDHGAQQPWVLASDRPAGQARVREYRRRVHAEATYADCKGRGFAIERSKVTKLAHLDRLLLVLHLALWWAQQLGLRVIRQGQRRQYDRRDRRDLSVVHLGQARMRDRLDHGHEPPLPFHRRAGQWRYAWLA